MQITSEVTVCTFQKKKISSYLIVGYIYISFIAIYIPRKINIKLLILETIFVSETYSVEQKQFFHGTPKYQQVP